MSGDVNTLEVRSHLDTTDYRLTVFDKLWYGNFAGILFVILTWTLSVTIGALKLYKELGN